MIQRILYFRQGQSVGKSVGSGRFEEIGFRLLEDHPTADEVFQVPFKMLINELNAGTFDLNACQLGDVRVLQPLQEGNLSEQRGR